MTTETISIPNENLFKLKCAYERLFLPQKGDKPRMPARLALNLVECIERLNQANNNFLKAITHMTANAEGREEVQKTLRDLGKEEREIAVVMIPMDDLEQYDVYVDPEALIIFRGNGVLLDEKVEA